jgi:hypothetical protein
MLGPLPLTRAARARRVTPFLLLALLWAVPAPGQPPPVTDTVETDPIRCWWRSSAGAVRTGETFTVVLTCAVLETDPVQVVPDETKLAAAVMQMTPFEVVGGSHPSDLRTGQRRFFQYEYVLRAINPDLIGRDVPLPNLQINYRVNSRLSDNAAQQGRELTYLLPPHAVRVMSMVPDEASDIRDTSNVLFGRIESLTSRASVLEVVAMTLIALGSLMTILAIVGVFRRTRPATDTGERPVGAFALAHLAARQLADVQREVGQHGWTDASTDRALAASRVIAACALGRGPNQRPGTNPLEAGDGRLVHRRLLRRGRPVMVSSPVTGADLAAALDRLPSATPPAHRERLDDLRQVLTAFAAARYGRTAGEREPLDAALSKAVEHARAIRTERLWPRDTLRRWTARVLQPHRQT